MKHLWLMMVGNGENNVPLETEMNWCITAIWLTFRILNYTWSAIDFCFPHWIICDYVGIFICFWIASEFKSVNNDADLAARMC